MWTPEMRHGAALVAVALLALLAAGGAGCGDDDGPGTGEDRGSPRKARFVEEAQAVCSGRNAKLRRALAVPDEAVGRLRGALVAKLTEVTLPAVARQVSALRELDIPLSQFTRIEAILDEQEEAVAQLEGLDGVRSFRIVEIHFAEADGMWEDYGLEGCAVRTLGR